MNDVKVKNQTLIEYLSYSFLLSILIAAAMGIFINRALTNYLIKSHIQLYSFIIEKILSNDSEVKKILSDKNVVFKNQDHQMTNLFFFNDTISRAELWDNNGDILWSSEKNIIGKNFYKNKVFQEALTGKTAYDISVEKDDKNTGKTRRVKTFKLYIPLLGANNVIGVIKLYEENSTLTNVIKFSNRVIWVTIGSCFAVYYMLLFSTFSKSNKKNNEILEKLIKTQDATILALAHEAELRDNSTGKHLIRTAKYVEILAKELKKRRNDVSKSFVDNIIKAAPLHDIGKVGIPDRILLKPAKLSAEEFSLVKKHCDMGAGTLKMAKEKLGYESFLDIAIEVTLNHHEKWDGTGYPRGLKGEEIPISGRIMAMADVYDALRSRRVYKNNLSHEEALRIILSEKGISFDPDLVEIFLEKNKVFENLSIELSDIASEKLATEIDMTTYEKISQAELIEIR